MTDQPTSQTPPPKKDDANKKPANALNKDGANRGQRRNPSVSRQSGGGPPRPSSRSSNKKSSTAAGESGSESTKKVNETKKNDQRKGQNGSQGGRNGGHRKASSSAQGNRQNAPGMTQTKSTGASVTGQGTDPSDALSSLQRVIADLKTTSPPNQTAPLQGGNITSSASMPLSQPSTLPVNAPAFHPGASAYPPNVSEPPPRHRKAASLGNGSLSGNFNNFSPHLGSMMEDAEEGAMFEEGEIPQSNFNAQGHHPRSQSQSFVAPRFAALAAEQQQQGDVLGPSGRPQLAPNFMFGARRRPSSNAPLGPAISEEDVNFQFPQQQQNMAFGEAEPAHGAHRRTESNGEIRGIMAEQVVLIARSRFPV